MHAPERSRDLPELLDKLNKKHTSKNTHQVLSRSGLICCVKTISCPTVSISSSAPLPANLQAFQLQTKMIPGKMIWREINDGYLHTDKK